MLSPLLWGALGACRPLLSFQGKLPTWAVRGKPSALTSPGSQLKCLTMMVQMESNTSTGHPEAKGKKITRSSQISAKLVPPSYVTGGGRGTDPCFWGPSAVPEKQPRHPGKGWNPAPEQGWGYTTHYGLLWTPSLDYPAMVTECPAYPPWGQTLRITGFFLTLKIYYSGR